MSPDPLPPGPRRDLAPPESRRFVLDVEPAAPGQPWHARLRGWDQGAVTEFDNPFELVRFLEQLRHDERPRPGRLR